MRLFNKVDLSPLRSRVILAIDIAAALVAYRRVHSSMPWHVPYSAPFSIPFSE